MKQEMKLISNYSGVSFLASDYDFLKSALSSLRLEAFNLKTA